MLTITHYQNAVDSDSDQVIVTRDLRNSCPRGRARTISLTGNRGAVRVTALSGPLSVASGDSECQAGNAPFGASVLSHIVAIEEKRELDMAATMTTTSNQRAELDRVIARLDDGWNKINEAEARGQDVTRWEDVWLGLLDEYEALYRDLADGATR